MAVYIAIFLIPALFSMCYRVHNNAVAISYRTRPLWLFIVFVLTLAAGARFEVGADWEMYKNILNESRNEDFFEVVFGAGADPAYDFLNYFGANIFGGIFLVNTVCGLIFALGLSRFCLAQKRPWLALVVAIPYLFTVVSLGYTRQGVAIALIMWGLTHFFSGSITKFVMFIVLAFCFHKSAIFMALLLLAFTTIRHLKLQFIFLIPMLIFLFFYFVDGILTVYASVYIANAVESGGAFYRTAITAVAGGVYLAGRKKICCSDREKKVWGAFAVVSILMFATLFFVDASTAIDRVGLYLLPLQIFVFSNIPDMVSSDRAVKLSLKVLLFIALLSILVGWLQLATHSFFWNPYKTNFFAVFS